MVAVIENQTIVEHLTIDDLEEKIEKGTLKYLSDDKYIRTEQPEYTKKLKELLFFDEKGKPYLKITSPIPVREIDDYLEIIDGNNRVKTLIYAGKDDRTLAEIFEEKVTKSSVKICDLTVADIPYILVNVPDDELLITQIKYNDTTDPHSIYDKACAIVDLYAQNLNKYQKSKAGTITQRQVGLSRSSFTHYLKAVEFSRKSELIKDCLQSGFLTVRLFYDLASKLISFTSPKDDDVDVIESAIMDLKKYDVEKITNSILSGYLKQSDDNDGNDESNYPEIIDLDYLLNNRFIDTGIEATIRNLISEQDVNELELSSKIKWYVENKRGEGDAGYILDDEGLESVINTLSFHKVETEIQDYTLDNFVETNAKLKSSLKGFKDFISTNMQPHQVTELNRSGLLDLMLRRLKKRIKYGDTTTLQRAYPQLIELILNLIDEDVDMLGDALDKETSFFVSTNENILSKIQSVLEATPKQPKSTETKLEQL